MTSGLSRGNILHEQKSGRLSKAQIEVSGKIPIDSECQFSTDRIDNENLPRIVHSEHISLIADARLYYREELLENLKEHSLDSFNISDAELILKAYNRWGEKCVQFLYGDYAFAVWNSDRGELFCARDHFGCRPFFYYIDTDYFIFASDIKQFSEFEEVTLNIRDDIIAKNATAEITLSEFTHYTNIVRLKPAHCLLVRKNEVEIEKYWELKHKEDLETYSDDQARLNFEKLLRNAVRERLKTEYPVGVELSGGLDSSGIAAISSSILQSSKREIVAFSHVMSSFQKAHYFPFSDETAYSDLVVKRCGISKHIKVDGEQEGAYHAIENGLKTLHGPTLPNYAMFSDLLYTETNREGIKILLSGLGGDEMVSSRVPGAIEETIYKKDWNRLRQYITGKNQIKHKSSLGSEVTFWMIRCFPGIVRLARSISLKRIRHRICLLRFVGINDRRRRKSLSKSLLNFKLVERSEDPVRIQQRNQLNHESIVARIENTHTISRRYGLEYAYPLLDVKLIQFYFDLPARIKYKGGLNRYLFRKVMEPYLPSEIVWRRDKMGITIPNLQYRIQEDMMKFRELIISESNASQYHYFDNKKLLKMATLVEQRGKGKRICFGPRLFIYAMQILILQKWQREGIIDIGIKC